ncbi:putative nitric oxide-associated protein 1-like, partial [Capsicum annuum]
VLKDSFTSLLQTLVLQMPVTGLYEGKTFAQDFQATQKILQHAKPLSQIPLVGLLFIPPVNLIAVGKVAVRAATNPVFPPDVIDVHEILRCSQQRTEISLRSSLREDVQWLRNELLFMQSFLKDAEEMQSGDERVQQWVFEINSAANDAVAILETYNFEAGEGEGVGDGFATRLKACACICRKETKLYKVGKEIQSLEQQIMDISRK